MGGGNRGDVRRFRERDDREELARLRRLTGLDYVEVPASLLPPPTAPDGKAPAATTDTPDQRRRGT